MLIQYKTCKNDVYQYINKILLKNYINKGIRDI